MIKDSNKEFAEAFAKLYVSTINMTKNEINMFDIRIKFYEELLNNLVENEPLKIFKKTHKNWKTKYNNLIEKIDNLYSQQIECYVDYSDLVFNK